MPRVYPAYAKINLGLHILGKRTDGYHEIETIFHYVQLHDEIWFTPSDAIAVTSSDPEAPGDETNLGYKAAALLRQCLRVDDGVRVHIRKGIPVGAGLGGGSSDAATVLKTLPGFWNRPLPREEIREIALALGSDVPFFLGSESAYATGRGEILESFPLELPYSILICFPGVHVSTAWAYAQLDLRPLHPQPSLRRVVAEGITGGAMLSGALTNDFEPVVFEKFPAIGDVKRTILAGGAQFAAMTGSGSAVYGLFSDSLVAKHTEETLRQQGYATSLTPPHFTPA